MSAFLESRKTTPSSIGHMLLMGVLIAVPVLMFAPNLILRWDARSIDVGDEVAVTQDPGLGGPYKVMDMSGGKLKLQATHDSNNVFWLEHTPNIKER